MACSLGNVRILHYQSEYIEHNELNCHGNNHRLIEMAMTVMSYFVGKYTDDFRRVQLFDKGIIKDDAFTGAVTGEISISVGGTFGTIDDVNIANAETYTGSKFFYLVSQRSFFKRCLTVE